MFKAVVIMKMQGHNLNIASTTLSQEQHILHVMLIGMLVIMLEARQPQSIIQLAVIEKGIERSKII
jgi:hypothetical protein